MSSLTPKKAYYVKLSGYLRGAPNSTVMKDENTGSEGNQKADQGDLSRRDFQKLLGVSGAAVLGGVSLAGCQGETSAAIACPYCDTTFETESALKDHLVDSHEDELRAALGDGPYPCPYCEEEFESLSELRPHIKAEHLDAVNLPAEWDEEVDVLVVGSGFAGLAAAIEAKEAGSSTLVLEKMPRIGGNSRINGGLMSVVGSDYQEEAGIEDSVDLFMDDLLEAGRGLNHPELIRFLGEHTFDTYQWTKEHLGVEWSGNTHLGGHSVPRSASMKEGSGWGVVRKERDKLEELGVEIRTGTYLDEILRNQEGAVVGLKVREDYEEGDADSGEEKFIKANEGVVLATGGFGEDLEFRLDQWPYLDENMDTTNHSGATAEALKEAIRKGADPLQLSWIQLGPWTSPDESGFGVAPGFHAGAAAVYGIWVDPETGERFVNELEDRRTRAEAQLNLGSDPEYPISIADSVAASHREAAVQTGIEHDVVFEFDSLEALANEFGIPLEGLKSQIEEWNSYVESGTDDQFGKYISDAVEPLGTPPWYAARLWPKVHHTMGGVEINVDTEVIEDDEPIPNLYAAGEVAGGVHGGCRLGSAATADCLVYGRLAGAKAAGASNPYK